MIAPSSLISPKLLIRSNKMRNIQKSTRSTEPINIVHLSNYSFKTISEINGLRHISLYNNMSVETRGIVTTKKTDGFYLQDGVNNVDGSSGIFVYTKNQKNYLDMVSIGDFIKIRGNVFEFGNQNELSVTEITSIKAVTIESKNNSLPSPINIGKEYNNVPSLVIDNGNIDDFDQHAYAIDYWENYESMLVRIDSPKVIGKLFNNREFHTTLDMDNPNRIITKYGGVVLAQNGNADIITISNSLISSSSIFSNLYPGDSISYITGVVSYAFGVYTIIPRNISDIGRTQRGTVYNDLQSSTPSTPPAYVNEEKLFPLDTTPHISMITQNMFNLSSKPNVERMAKYARVNLLSPEIVFMQEIQDDSGIIDDGVVSSNSNLDTLCNLLNDPSYNTSPYPIRKYEYVYVPPENNEDGGQPGGNIRVVILYDSLSISIEEYYRLGLANSTPPPETNNTFLNTFLNTRKPLYVKIKHNSTKEIYHLIAVHLSAKNIDTKLWGSVQPPIKISESLRVQQTTYIKDWITHNFNKNVDNIIIAGDFNDHEWSNALKVLDDNTPNRFMKNLVNDVKESERYSYYVNGVYQTLDHIIVSIPLYQKITNVFETDVNIPNKPYIKFSDVLTSQFWIQKIGEPILTDHNTLCARIPLPLPLPL